MASSSGNDSSPDEMKMAELSSYHNGTNLGENNQGTLDSVDASTMSPVDAASPSVQISPTKRTVHYTPADKGAESTIDTAMFSVETLAANIIKDAIESVAKGNIGKGPSDDVTSLENDGGTSPSPTTNPRAVVQYIDSPTSSSDASIYSFNAQQTIPKVLYVSSNVPSLQSLHDSPTGPFNAQQTIKKAVHFNNNIPSIKRMYESPTRETVVSINNEEPMCDCDCVLITMLTIFAVAIVAGILIGFARLMMAKK